MWKSALCGTRGEPKDYNGCPEGVRADGKLGGPSSTGYAAEPVDIWGMGVVLYTLLVGSEYRPSWTALLGGRNIDADGRYTMGRAVRQQSGV